MKSSALTPKCPVALAREGRGGVGRCPRQASWTDPGRGPLTRGLRVAGSREPGGGPHVVDLQSHTVTMPGPGGRRTEVEALVRAGRRLWQGPHCP